MKIEAGKCYKTRDGRKVGPMDRWPSDDAWQSLQQDRPLRGGLWNIDGTALYAGSFDSPDLIAEWTEGPVRTVTRTVTEIVPGEYSYVEVGEIEGNERVPVAIGPCAGLIPMTASELKAAAAVLLELAGALSDGE